MERGTSYRVWQDASTVKLYKATNIVATQVGSWTASNAVGQSHSYVLRYTLTGRLVVWRDGVQLGSWTDPSPLSSGSYLALRTDAATVSFDDIEAARFKKYYDAGGQRVAMREAETVSFLLGDHLNSTAVTANSSGGEAGKLLYKPWGETRYSSGTTPTSYRFTGQREDVTIGLYFYNSRYYDPVLGRFTQPDTVVPEPGKPQSLNRYAYVLNNPLSYTDPTGHRECGRACQGDWIDPWLIGSMYAGPWDIAQQERNQRLAANVTGTILSLTPVLETGDDLLTLTSGCGYACQMGGEASVGWGWRAVSGAALLVPGVGGAWFREANEAEGIAEGFKSFTRRNFRENLKHLTGKSAEQVVTLEAHHMLPQKFIRDFQKAGLDIHYPRFGSWVETAIHRGWSYEYNARWELFLQQVQSPKEILRFAEQLAEEYGLHVNFDVP